MFKILLVEVEQWNDLVYLENILLSNNNNNDNVYSKDDDVYFKISF